MESAAQEAGGRQEPVPDRVDEQHLLALRPDLLRYAQALARNEDKAQDLVQDAYERALKNKDRFDPRKGVLKAWLRTIVHNLFLSSLRRDKFHVTGDPDELMRHASVPEMQNAELDARQLEALLEKLGPAHRAVLGFLKDDLSYDEMAGRLGVARDSVKTRVIRARRAFAQVLYEAGFLESDDPMVARYLDKEPAE